jgi:hypothetical protein
MNGLARRGTIAVATLFLASVAAIPAPTADGVTSGLDDRLILNPLAEYGLDRLQGFRDRPLFVSTRRPPPPVVEQEPYIEPVAEYEPEPEPEPEPETFNVTLSGIMEIDGEPLALVRDENEGTTSSVRVGDTLEGWTVASIGEGSVSLSRDDRTQDIKIFQPGSSGREGVMSQMALRSQEMRGLNGNDRRNRLIPALSGNPAPEGLEEDDLEQEDDADEDWTYEDDEDFEDGVFDAAEEDDEFMFDAASENGGAIDDDMLEGTFDPDSPNGGG